MVELERRGIPTVLFTAQTFVHDAHRSAASFGLAGLPLAVVPLPFTNQTPADIHGMAERAFDQVRAGLTRPVEAPKAVERPPLDERLRYDGDDLLDARGRMQADFLVRGWADGFPLVDRKSTRLNSSHGYISYAVFCLKKKKTTIESNRGRPSTSQRL